MPTLGILFALGALVCWGVGDFLIQKSTRKAGSIASLFYICALASIFLLPFIKNDLINLFANRYNLALLLITGITAFFAGLFYFQALERGKISIVEPILSIELPITAGLGVIILNEHVNIYQAFFIILIFIGIVLAITKEKYHLHYHKRLFEKGVMLAGIGAISMALFNILLDVSSHNTSPLFAVWFAHLVIAVFCLIYMLASGSLTNTLKDFRKYPKLIISTSVLDTAAWIFFAYSVTMIPIAIATAVSESYIALAVILGIFVNREKIKKHQLIGASMAIISAILLSSITG